MNRQDRAKQFNPFDALKGLKEAIELANFKHERIEKGDILEDKVEEICQTLNSLCSDSIVNVQYHANEHIFEIKGYAKIDYINKFIAIDGKKILFDDILDIKKIN